MKPMAEKYQAATKVNVLSPEIDSSKRSTVYKSWKTA